MVNQVINQASLYAELDNQYAAFAGHTLIAMHQFKQDGPSWECHPKGDEIVVLMAGACEFVLKTKDGRQHLALNQPGEYVVVPKGGHTAKIDKHASMLFITPGENTQHAEHP